MRKLPMNRREIIKLIGVLSANYRNWPAEGKEEDTVMLWESMLSDIPYEIGAAAVKMHMSKSVYPPTIADIREATAHINAPHQMDAMEAWNLISQAIRKYGFYRQKEAIESLPEDVAKMVDRFGWRELCYSTNIDTIRAQFRMAWETMQKRQHQERLMPANVLQMIENNAVKRLE